jgi:hypothetical protein
LKSSSIYQKSHHRNSKNRYSINAKKMGHWAKKINSWSNQLTNSKRKSMEWAASNRNWKPIWKLIKSNANISATNSKIRRECTRKRMLKTSKISKPSKHGSTHYSHKQHRNNKCFQPIPTDSQKWWVQCWNSNSNSQPSDNKISTSVILYVSAELTMRGSCNGLVRLWTKMGENLRVSLRGYASLCCSVNGKYSNSNKRSTVTQPNKCNTK